LLGDGVKPEPSPWLPSAAAQAEVAKFSRRDADALPEYYAMLDRVAAVLRAFHPLLNGRELLVGRLAPGEERTATVEATVPGDLRERRKVLCIPSDAVVVEAAGGGRGLLLVAGRPWP
jgi:hypothetical protein